MKLSKHKLSNFQITVMIASSIIGVVVLTLPRLATKGALVDGAPVTFIIGLLTAIVLVFVVMLCRRFPNHTIIEFSQIILGKILGRMYGLGLTTYFIVTTGVILRIFSDALKILLIPRTPLEFVMISMLLVVSYLVQKGISSISKICEIFIPVILLPLSLLILLNLNDMDLSQLKPMFSRGLLPVVQSMPSLLSVYLGFEIVFFLSPFMKTPKKILPYSIAGISIPVIIYTSLVITCIAIFGVKPTSTLVYPTIVLARRIIFPGAFIERFDILFIFFWILAAFTTISIYMYMASISVTRVMGFRNFKPFIFILTPFIYLVAILPQNILEIEWLSFISGIMGSTLILISVPMLAIALIRKKGS